MNKPTATDYALATGIVLGEGCLGIYKKSGRVTYSPRIYVGMQDKGTIEWLHSTFGGFLAPKSSKEGLWVWRLEGRLSIHSFLLNCLEYMKCSTEKYPQALILLMFCTSPRLHSLMDRVEYAKRLDFHKKLQGEIANLKPRNNPSGVRSRFVTNLLVEPN